MKSTLAYVLLLTVVFLTSCKQGQTNTPGYHIGFQTKPVSTPYGPNTMVRNIKNGRNGTVLIAASLGGVFRYDGKLFTSLTSQLGSRRFWDVLEDQKGNLWFSTTDLGVYCYNGKSFQHFTTREGLASNVVMSIYEDRAGMIWFGTSDGASRYDGKSFQNLTIKQGLPYNAITTILEDKNGKFWFGTRGYACFYDGKKFTVFKNKDGKAFHNVWGITEDKKGQIWFGATTIEDRKGDTLIVKAGLWRYDGSTFAKINQRGTSAIIEDKKGNIWTTGAVNPNGVGAWTFSRYDQNSLYNKKPEVAEIMSIEKMLCGIFEANDGSIWFGSLNGVYRYDGKTITDFKKKEAQHQ